MGAWGVTVFENDDASDWLANLEKSEGHSLIYDALRAVVNAEYAEAPDCEAALAAAEIVAALRGLPHKSLPEEATAWVEEDHSLPPPDLLTLARQAVVRVRSESELKDLWAESEELEDWLKGLAELERRLV